MMTSPASEEMTSPAASVRDGVTRIHAPLMFPGADIERLMGSLFLGSDDGGFLRCWLFASTFCRETEIEGRRRLKIFTVEEKLTSDVDTSISWSARATRVTGRESVLSVVADMNRSLLSENEREVEAPLFLEFSGRSAFLDWMGELFLRLKLFEEPFNLDAWVQGRGGNPEFRAWKFSALVACNFHMLSDMIQGERRREFASREKTHEANFMIMFSRKDKDEIGDLEFRGRSGAVHEEFTGIDVGSDPSGKEEERLTSIGSDVPPS